MPDKLLRAIESKYAPPDHVVFQLTPPEFNRRATHFLEHKLGSPIVTMNSFWDIYSQLLHLFQAETAHNTSLIIEVEEFSRDEEQVNAETVELLEGQQELRYNGMVIGEEGLPDEEIANPFFRHDSENYLEVELTDEEEDEGPLEVSDFTDDSEEEVESSLLM